MEDSVFEEVRAAIDVAIDDGKTDNLGIAMSFSLAGEFMKRGLLEIVTFQMLGNWDARKYRGKFINPDPMLDGADYKFGS